MEENEATRNNHASVLAALAEAQANAAELALPIEDEFQLQRIDLLKRETTLSVKAYSRAYAKLDQWRNVQLRRLWRPVSKVESSREHRLYLKDHVACCKRTLLINRSALLQEIKTLGVAQDKLIVVTHERLFRFADEGVFPLLHIFGHRHEFKYTQHIGTHYLNAAALDTEAFNEGGGYCIVELTNEHVRVERRHIANVAM